MLYTTCLFEHQHKQMVLSSKVIRVVAEGIHKGRVGKVTSVCQYEGSEPTEKSFQAQDESATKVGGIFVARSTEVMVERDDYTEACPFKLDYHSFKQAKRAIVAKDLAISNTELIEDKVTLELGTVHAPC